MIMEEKLQEILSYYRRQGAPQDQNALIQLLRDVQQEYGGSVPAYLLAPIAENLGIKPALLNALIRRIPSLRLSDSHTLELCAGPNCGKHTALASLAEQLVQGRQDVKLSFTPCMRMCAKGPNLRWDGRLYHKADETLLRSLLQK